MSNKKVSLGTIVFVLEADKEFGFFIPKPIGLGVVIDYKRISVDYSSDYWYIVKNVEEDVYAAGHYDPFYDDFEVFFRTPEKQIQMAKDYLIKLVYIYAEEDDRLKQLNVILKTPGVDTSVIKKRIPVQEKVVKSLQARIAEVQKRLDEYNELNKLAAKYKDF